MRWPVQSTLGIEEFVGGEITVAVSMVTNGIFQKRSDGKLFTTQRPSINISKDASADVSDLRGRGCFYWSANSALYFVNDNKVYKGAYSVEVVEATVSTTLTRSGSTATAAATAHGYKNGDKITIAGANETEYNGEFVISNVSANAFDYTVTGTPATPATGTITSQRSLGGGGTDKVYFFEIGNYLVIIDPEDNSGWYIAVGAPQVLVEITDTDFPGHLASATLARGGAVLDGTLYVMNTAGTLSASGLEDPTAWGALDVIEAEVQQDGGVMLSAHLNHVVAFGQRTIEFFYDAANPTGSPLSVREDVSHEMGLTDFDTVWSANNELFFVAQSSQGSVGVYRMQSFMPAEISTPDLATFLTAAVHADSKKLLACGFTSGSDSYYILTVYHLNGNSDIAPLESVVYSTLTNTWTRFELMHSGIDDCPLVDFAVTNATQLGEGILANGDVVTIADDFAPQDSTLAQGGVYEAGVYEAGVYTAASAGIGTNISMEIITGHSDSDTVNRKFMNTLRLAGPVTEASQTMTVQWSDESNQDYNSGKTIDTSLPGRRVTRLGSYRQRNFKLTYAGSERIELDALEVDLKAGNY